MQRCFELWRLGRLLVLRHLLNLLGVHDTSYLPVGTCVAADFRVTGPFLVQGYKPSLGRCPGWGHCYFVPKVAWWRR